VDSRFESVADAIETQVCVEIRRPGGMQGVVKPLGLAARAKQGAAPVMLAAQRLVDSVLPGSVVVVSTGFYVPGAMPRGETDGPPGAAALAYAVSRGLGAIPLLLAEESTLEPIRAACRAIGLHESNLDSARDNPLSFVAQAFPTDGRAESEATHLLKRLQPAAVVVTERPGVNHLGVAHRGGGMAIEEGRARIETVTKLARVAGIPFIAIGDNGNEAGMGLIVDETRRYKPFGAVCRCPCGGGIAAVDEADVTVFGSVSNWAAYGVVACLGLLLGRADLLHDAVTEEKMIAASLEAGAVDGISLRQQMAVDEIPAGVNGAVVDILRAIVTAALDDR
jgi:hypothetical protein